MHEDKLYKHDPWNSRLKLFFLAFALIGGFFLIAEHQAHVLPFLPWLLLGGCVFMHLFMHGGHGHGGHRMETPDAAIQRPSATVDSSQVGLGAISNAPPGFRSEDHNLSGATTPPVDRSHHHEERPS